MTRPTAEQIDIAIHRAAEAGRTLSRHPDRLTMLPAPPRDDDLVDGRFWFIGWIVVLGEPEEWRVLYDPAMDEGRLRAKRAVHERASDCVDRAQDHYGAVERRDHDVPGPSGDRPCRDDRAP